MLAVICGMVSRLIASTMPTMRRVATIVMAIMAIRVYSITLTGNCWARENTGSKATLTMLRKKTMVSMLTARVNTPNSTRSATPIVSRLPKRYEFKSGINSGERKQQIMPTLMPKVQKKAMVESSRTLPRCESHCTPRLLATAKTMAEITGLMPKYTPSPMPPKEAWVMPPLINTSLRVTI